MGSIHGEDLRKAITKVLPEAVSLETGPETCKELTQYVRDSDRFEEVQELYKSLLKETRTRYAVKALAYLFLPPLGVHTALEPAWHGWYAASEGPSRVESQKLGCRRPLPWLACRSRLPTTGWPHEAPWSILRFAGPCRLRSTLTLALTGTTWRENLHLHLHVC